MPYFFFDRVRVVLVFGSASSLDLIVVLTVILSPRGKTRRFFPWKDAWRVSNVVVGAAKTEAAEQRARRL